MLRFFALLGLACAFFTGCSGGGVARGKFNNHTDYKIAMREHESAWRREVGDTVTKSKLRAVIKGAGGECFPEGSLTICVVNVESSGHGVFVTRHMWRIRFKEVSKDKLQKQSSHVDILGWDL